MDTVKKNIKRIWNSKCKYLVIIACALILANGVNLLQAGLKFINSDGEEVEEKKSIVITSSTWESKGPGSWKVEKSAEWTGIKRATIKFDVETNGLTGHTERDIILVLDNSGSMNTKVNGRQKLAQLQSDTTELINFLLTEEGTRIAVINFNTKANLLSGFTSDRSKLTSVVNGLSTTGGTNYKNAYQAVINLLSGYEEAKDRDLVMLFLTDGGAPAASAEYQILKDNYHIQICGIQYELGSSIKKSIIESSDVQYAANTINLKSIFFESIGVESYEKFEITDYISKEFIIENISDIRVSRGEVKLEKDGSGKQKVIWKIPTSDVKFITSFSATMELDVVYKGELEPDRVIKTNEKEKVKVELPDPSPTPGPEIIESEEVPVIRGGYYVTYDPNLPSECNPDGKDMTLKKAYFPYEKVDRSPGNYTCKGWQIREWKIDGTVLDLGGDQFTMPSGDVKITAIWTKIDIDKKMEGTIADPVSKGLLEAMKKNAGSSISVDTGINFGSSSSASNGRGLYIRNGTQSDTNPIYYYRGNVSNNNVLFAGICWQIVRTTESGGIKLIYNGVSSDGKTCTSIGDTHIGNSNFQKTGYENLINVGYMYGKSNSLSSRSDSLSSYYFGHSVSYSSGQYSLSSTKRSSKPDSYYHYTCMQTSASKTCTSGHYVYNAGSSYGNNYIKYYIYLMNGDTLSTAKSQAFTNTNSSKVKTVIDSWYKTNIEYKGYTKYLDEDTVWCNDRTIIDGGLYSESAAFGYSHFAFNNRSTNPAVKESTACSSMNDRFTVSHANTGNKALTYPVGMLTADEGVLAGLTASLNNNISGTDSYLYKGYGYWTMTPLQLGETASNVSNIYTINGSHLDTSSKVRPAISLKPGILVYEDGYGTREHPYEVAKKQ